MMPPDWLFAWAVLAFFVAAAGTMLALLIDIITTWWRGY